MEKDIEDSMLDDAEDVVFLIIKADKTVNIRTSVMDMEELKSILSTAYMMATFHDVKRDDYGIDKMH